MPLITQSELDAELDRLGTERLRAVVKLDTHNPWSVPALVLAVASRETWIENIDGDPENKDGNGKGAWQIDKRSWANWLSQVPGVANGTWDPVVPHVTALDDGYCPTLEDGVKQAIAILKDYWDQTERWAPESQHIRAMVASYNAGPGGAFSGWEVHRDVDYFTTGQNYASDVLGRQNMVHAYLLTHRLVKK
jgi:hypothetical protein